MKTKVIYPLQESVGAVKVRSIPLRSRAVIGLSNVWLGLVCLLLGVSSCFGASYTFVGSGDWSVAANWSPNGVPGSTDTATINNTGTVTVSANTDVGILNLNSGSLNGAGTLTVSNTMNWTGGDMGGTGKTVIAPGATLNISNTSYLTIQRRTLENAGTTIWSGSSFLNCKDPGTIISNRVEAVWEVRSNQPFNNDGGGEFYNAGTFRKSASTGTTAFGFPFHNTGTVDLQTGTLDFSTLYNSGSTTVSNGTLLSLRAGSATGQFTVGSAAGLEWVADSYSLNPGASLSPTGNYTNSSSGVLNVNTAVAIQNFWLAGTLRGTGTLTVSNAMNWTAGNMGGGGGSGGGKTIVAPGATLTISNTSHLSLQNWTLENGGTVIWSGTSYLNCKDPGTILSNRAEAVWEVRCDQPFVNDAGGAFYNAGIFRKTASTGTTTFGFSFNNHGTVSILSGNVSFSQDFHYYSASNAVLDLGIGGTTPGTGFGNLQSSGAIALNGALSVGFINGFVPNPGDVFTGLVASAVSGTFSNFYYPSNTVGMAVSNTPTAVYVKVINVLPTVPVIANQTNDEMVLFSLAVNATDADVPPQTLTYTLTNSPTGATINSSGLIQWTPTEEQGPMITNITVLVTDNGTPPLTTSRTFQIVVNEVNVAPVLTLPADQAFNEDTTFAANATATDSDIPANPSLVFELVSGPSGLTVGSSGAIAWTPTESQGSNSYPVTIRVIDTNEFAVTSKQLSTTNSFVLTVNEVNLPPTITVPSDQVMLEETAITLTATASDPDQPANTLSFSLLSPPTGMTIDSASGVISWTPTEDQGSNAFTVHIQVTDLNENAVNTKQLSVSNSFTIIVNESNRPPVLPSQSDRTMDELTLLTLTNTATDPDLPANVLTYTLLSAPSGAAISTNGVITWTPSEAQGPSSNFFVTIVTDSNPGSVNATSLAATNSFSVIVNEVNEPPTITCPADMTAYAAEPTGVAVTFSVTATDSDDPAPTVVCSPESGSAFAPGTTTVTCTATDPSGNTATCSFVVTVHLPDFGDAPHSPTYHTLLAHNGARHAIAGPFFGGSPPGVAHRDPESDGNPSLNADGDDVTDGNDDEQGIRFLDPLIAGRSVRIEINAPVPGLVNAWWDFNADHDWNDPGEKICADLLVGFGLFTTTVAIPAAATVGTPTYARFRINSVGGLHFDGPATDGEVEDYATTLLCAAPPLFLPTEVSGLATSSSGTAVSFTVTATSPCGLPTTVVCVPPSGSLFPIGTTLVACIASDSLGTSSTGEFPVTVRELAIVPNPNSLEVRWEISGMSLEEAPSASGPWTPVAGATSPFKVVPNLQGKFFRLKYGP